VQDVEAFIFASCGDYNLRHCHGTVSAICNLLGRPLGGGNSGRALVAVAGEKNDSEGAQLSEVPRTDGACPKGPRPNGTVSPLHLSLSKLPTALHPGKARRYFARRSEAV
jgi:hypothetical protein